MKRLISRSLLWLMLFGALLLTAGGVPEGSFSWSQSNCKKLHDGILYAEMKLTRPRPLRIYCARVDLKTPGLYLKITGRAKNWGEPMPDCPEFKIRTRRITTRKFLLDARKSGVNMVLAVNGSPWRPWQKPWTHKYSDDMGLVLSDGVLVCPPMKDRPSFVQRKDGSYGFETIPPDGDYSHLKNALSGFGMVLVKGKVSETDRGLAPRTGYGLSADGRYLILMVADGRQKGDSEGLTHREVGEFLQYFGAWDGINMDGGGSSSLVWWNPRDSKDYPKGAVFLNHQPNGGERTVGGQMGICFQ